MAAYQIPSPVALHCVEMAARVGDPVALLAKMPVQRLFARRGIDDAASCAVAGVFLGLGTFFRDWGHFAAVRPPDNATTVESVTFSKTIDGIWGTGPSLSFAVLSGCIATVSFWCSGTLGRRRPVE